MTLETRRPNPSSGAVVGGPLLRESVDVITAIPTGESVKFSLTVDVRSDEGVSKAKSTEMRVALPGLCMSEEVHIADTPDSGSRGVNRG